MEFPLILIFTGIMTIVITIIRFTQALNNPQRINDFQRTNLLITMFSLLIISTILVATGIILINIQ